MIRGTSILYTPRTEFNGITIIDPISSLTNWTIVGNIAAINSGIVDNKLKFSSISGYSSTESYFYNQATYAGAFALCVDFSGFVLTTNSGARIAHAVFRMTDYANANLVFGIGYDGLVPEFTDGTGYRVWTFDGASNVERAFVVSAETQGKFAFIANSDRSSVQAYKRKIDDSGWDLIYTGNLSSILNGKTLFADIGLSGGLALAGDVVSFSNFASVVIL